MGRGVGAWEEVKLRYTNELRLRGECEDLSGRLGTCEL